jgi:hypothetical protein
MTPEGLDGRVAVVTGGGSDLVPTRSGRYSDDLRRIDGRWVFTVRRISIAFDRESAPAR